MCVSTGQEQKSLFKSMQFENEMENSHMRFENTWQKNKMQQ